MANLISNKSLSALMAKSLLAGVIHMLTSVAASRASLSEMF